MTKLGIDGLRLMGKFSSIGVGALASCTDLVGELEKPSRPSSGGGVGVRGGSGIGRLEADMLLVEDAINFPHSRGSWFLMCLFHRHEKQLANAGSQEVLIVELCQNITSPVGIEKMPFAVLSNVHI